jgi:hypothetical protein
MEERKRRKVYMYVSVYVWGSIAGEGMQKKIDY